MAADSSDVTLCTPWRTLEKFQCHELGTSSFELLLDQPCHCTAVGCCETLGPWRRDIGEPVEPLFRHDKKYSRYVRISVKCSWPFRLKDVCNCPEVQSRECKSASVEFMSLLFLVKSGPSGLDILRVVVEDNQGPSKAIRIPAHDKSRQDGST